MNVLITNKLDNELSSLDIDIIKHVTGTFNSNEIVDMFKSFFFNKMIIDITAIKESYDINNIKVLSEGLETEKLIFYLPEGTDYCSPNYLSDLITVGIYNFTTNLDGVKYLLNKSNTYKDVAHIQKLGSTGATTSNVAVSNDEPIEGNNSTDNTSQENNNISSVVIGFKDVTEHAGASTLIYLLVKKLSNVYDFHKILGIEVEKSDFKYFDQKNMITATSNELRQTITNSNAKIVLVDLNKTTDTSMCNVIIYLIEPSILKLNKMIDRNNLILDKLKNKKVMLNKSLLTKKDVLDLQRESGLKFFYNMPPLNDRKSNEIIDDFLQTINLIKRPSTEDSGQKIFGLFRR